ncbi:hypothetical protein D3C71_1406330 [compost metagenome]
MPGPARAGRDTGQQQARRLFAGIRHVHMRIGAKGDQRIGLLQHLRGDVGVQVQAGHDGHVRPHDLAHPRQQFAFAIVQVFGDHRAVQVQVDSVVAARPRGIQDFAGNTFKRVARDVGRGACSGPDHGMHAMPLRLDGVDETACGNVDRAQRQHVLAARHGGKAFAPDKVVVPGLGGRKGIGLVLEASHQDVHVVSSWIQVREFPGLPNYWRRRGLSAIALSARGLIPFAKPRFRGKSLIKLALRVPDGLA